MITERPSRTLFGYPQHYVETLELRNELLKSLLDTTIEIILKTQEEKRKSLRDAKK